MEIDHQTFCEKTFNLGHQFIVLLRRISEKMFNMMTRNCAEHFMTRLVRKKRHAEDKMKAISTRQNNQTVFRNYLVFPTHYALRNSSFMM